jgi:glycosyltransferase involved in cell wall biosynthesis
LIRVAYVTRAPFISGAERSLQTILQHASSGGIDPIVICSHGSLLLPWCQSHGIQAFAVPIAERDRRHPIRWLESVARIAHVLAREDVDILHSNQVWTYAAAGTAASWVGIPRVCHMRDEVGLDGIQWWCKSGVEAVICVSKHVQDLVTPAWDRSTAMRPTILTMINPVASGVADERSNTPSCDHWPGLNVGADNEGTVLGFIGQIVPVKGLALLLEILAGLKNRADWHLLVAGRDPHPGAPHELLCRDRVGELGLTDRVSFVGFLEDTSGFYRAIDVAVVPSLEEPLGRVPLEAARYGKPAIAFATGGLGETMLHGRTGWLARPGDREALREAIVTVLDSRSTIAAAGAEAARFVTQLCDPAIYVRNLASFYADLLRKADATMSDKSTRESPDESLTCPGRSESYSSPS